MGIHGEKGITVEKLMTADRTAGLLMERLLDDMPLPDGSEVSVLVNGLGGTPAEELFIVYRRVARILEERGVKSLCRMWANMRPLWKWRGCPSLCSGWMTS